MNAGRALDWAICGVGVLPGDAVGASPTPEVLQRYRAAAALAWQG